MSARTTALRGLVAALATLALGGGALAERADRDKPTQIEANRMSADDAKRLTIFEGNVVLSKGTLGLRADRIVVRQDAEGFQSATATGDPVRFRQRGDPKDGRAAVWLEGQAQRIEFDDRTEKVELHGRAVLTRDQDEVRGEHIVYDQRSEFFSVTGGKGDTPGRVRAVIQPKTPGAAPAAPSPAPSASPTR